MTAPFDPYHRWLGIHPNEQPADHYRLLGLLRFEDDVEVIRDAAERQMAHVRRYAVGEHADAAKRILNELGGAKACLTDREKRTRYDATLSPQTMPTSHVSPSTEAVTSPPPLDHAAPIPPELVENDSQPVSTFPDEDLPPPPDVGRNTFPQSSVPNASPFQPRISAESRPIRSPRPRVSLSAHSVLEHVDDSLRRIAGNGNVLLHGFLRAIVIAALVLVVAVMVFVTLRWMNASTSNLSDSVANDYSTVPAAGASVPTPSNPRPALPNTTPSNPSPALPNTTPSTPLILDPIANQAIDEAAELRLELTLADPGDKDESVSFEFVGPSHGAKLNPRGVFSWTPTEAQGPGKFPFRVRAVASSGAPPPRVSEPRAFQVMVLEINQPPRFEPINEQQATVGTELKLTLRATDPDLPANVLTFMPLNEPPVGDLDPATGEFRWTPSDSSVTGEYADLVVEVSDNGSPPQSARQTIRIHVNPKPLEQRITNSIGMELALIPAGEFLMGSTDADIAALLREYSGLTRESFAAEQPQHRVQIMQPFYLGITEVTRGEWQAVMRTTPWKGHGYVKEGSDYAATYVSWYDAVEFCRRLSATESRTYRLPTEAEWEYACRAGSTAGYSIGDTAASLEEYAWFNANALNVNEKYVHRVGQKRENAFGLFDMHGNVWEWCAEPYEDYTTAANPNPAGPAVGSIRVYRGGSWYSSPHHCRSANRIRNTPSHRIFNIGFRVCSSVK